MQSAVTYAQGQYPLDPISVYDYTLGGTAQNYVGFTNQYNQYASNLHGQQKSEASKNY